ncbi:uncharacterized protein TEOVI_000091000 [Trypanosoma equiperdum]|uniref:Uncharacterized protein n=1 Tax=Trypanosoma equiperdum TaxID=5694 RepID=A0A1G4IB77_TRYEQ|nr:hypothetical protein, conserved [Trypanosoma equiperdum]
MENVVMEAGEGGSKSNAPQNDDASVMNALYEPPPPLASDGVDDAFIGMALGECSLRDVYSYSCHRFGVRPNENILRQLPPVAGDEWVRKIKVLDFSAVYLGGKGCLSLVPIIERCTEATHLMMPNVGLTHEAAAPLFEVMRYHPSVSWMDVSKNRLNDDVGRWILNAVIENPRIRFVLLRDAGISPPLLQKIENRLHERMYGTVEAITPSIRVTYAEGFSQLFESSLGTGANDTARVPVHYVPPSVAAGLVELRHQLYRNAESMRCVYNCFTHNLTPESGGCASDAGTDAEELPETNSEAGFGAPHPDRCSWRSFFCGLRLLGVRAVCKSLEDSVTFANLCGICNVETVLFGKLIQLLRPHVAIKDEMTPESPPVRGNTIPNQFADVSPPLDVQQGASMDAEEIPSRDLSGNMRAATPEMGKPQADTPSVPTQEAGRMASEARCSPLTLRPLHCTLHEKRSSLGPSLLDTFVTTPSIAGVHASGPLEARLRLDRTFDSRNKQTVVDQLYDERVTLSEVFKKTGGEDPDASAPSYLVDIDEVIKHAVSRVGESNREIVKSLVEPWAVGVEDRVLVNTEGWLSSMYVPQLEASTLMPFSFSEEKLIWAGVTVEELRESVDLW